MENHNEEPEPDALNEERFPPFNLTRKQIREYINEFLNTEAGEYAMLHNTGDETHQQMIKWLAVKLRNERITNLLPSLDNLP